MVISAHENKTFCFMYHYGLYACVSMIKPPSFSQAALGFYAVLTRLQLLKVSLLLISLMDVKGSPFTIPVSYLKTAIAFKQPCYLW